MFLYSEGILYPEEILREGVLSQEGYFRRDYASELILDEGILSKGILTQRWKVPKVKSSEGERSEDETSVRPATPTGFWFNLFGNWD